ncbi:helix-turn-helix transcriptional regulator, partial [Nocardioides sp.]|uniref:helix-turn-helix transcriptional regulator n=1 Tax=Nocardioides sp. TaxID=35761 RepID=UPI00286E543F
DEAGLELATQSRERALVGGFGPEAGFCGAQIAEAMLYQGRFDEADLLLEDCRSEGLKARVWRALRIFSLIARGDFAAAEPLVRETLALFAEVVGQPEGYDLQDEVEVYCGLDDVAQALGLVREHLASVPWRGSLCGLPVTARAAWTAVACAVRAGVEVPADLMTSCDEVLAAALAAIDEEEELRSSLPASGALVADAFARTLDGESAVEAWRSAVEASAPYGAYHVLLPRLELAAALLGAGERDEARSLVTEVWQSARAMGARHYEQQAATLARRNRIQLSGEPVPPQLAALTAREREVLDVLASGATNRTIAERLFISEKTVSVHVTNLLAKLGVPNRGEAAALARELAND